MSYAERREYLRVYGKVPNTPFTTKGYLPQQAKLSVAPSVQ